MLWYRAKAQPPNAKLGPMFDGGFVDKLGIHHQSSHKGVESSSIKVSMALTTHAVSMRIANDCATFCTLVIHNKALTVGHAWRARRAVLSWPGAFSSCGL